MMRILVPYSGGSAGERALRAACVMAASAGEVHIVHVVRVPYHRPISADMSVEREQAERLLDHAYEIAHAYGVCATTILVETRRVEVGIVEAARGCDLVVLGQRERRWARIPFVRHRIHRYVRAHTPCHVLIVRPTDVAPVEQRPEIASRNISASA